SYSVVNNESRVSLNAGETVGIRNKQQLTGYQGHDETPSSILLDNNGLHIDIQSDPTSQIGKTDDARIEDIVMESAITSNMDCEDAVSAVDAEDKLGVYKNWLGLIRGELTTKVNKGSRTFERKFNEDRTYTTPDGGEITLPGRVLM